MDEELFIGIDAGTSQIKCVAFSATGEELAVAACENDYHSRVGGCVEQDALQTRDKMVDTLASLITELGADVKRRVNLSITSMGDGLLLLDADGKPLHKGWLWLDSRAADIATEIEQLPDYDDIFRITGTAINASQMRSQLLWIDRHEPTLLDRAHSAFHWKDYLYYCLTGVRVTDPSEALFTFGSFLSADYDANVLAALGLTHRSNLLPPIVDGMCESHPLLPEVASRVGLSASVPVTLGYVDVICSALGGGLYNKGAASAMTIMGTTGIHMRYAGSANELQLPDQQIGYTIAFPGGGFVQLQTNMAASLNIDWVLNLGIDVLASQGHKVSANAMLATLDDKLNSAVAGSALYHPYISTAGERGPFFNTDARASFEGLDEKTGYYDLARTVIEGLCFAARDCYQSLGEIPDEIRLTGGASKSIAIQKILASVLDRPVRRAQLQESGAAGAAMIATMKHGVYANLNDCTDAWLGNKLGDAVQPDAELVPHYEALFDVYVSSRQNRMSSGIWEQLASIEQKYKNHNS